MMEVKRSSELSGFTRATRRHIRAHGILHSHNHENHKSYIKVVVLIQYYLYYTVITGVESKFSHRIFSRCGEIGLQIYAKMYHILPFMTRTALSSSFIAAHGFTLQYRRVSVYIDSTKENKQKFFT
jgi:hypothetical protein